MEESLLHRNFELHYVLRSVNKEENNTFNEETNMKE